MYTKHRHELCHPRKAGRYSSRPMPSLWFELTWAKYTRANDERPRATACAAVANEKGLSGFYHRSCIGLGAPSVMVQWMWLSLDCSSSLLHEYAEIRTWRISNVACTAEGPPATSRIHGYQLRTSLEKISAVLDGFLTMCSVHKLINASINSKWVKKLKLSRNTAITKA